ncbi:hypothetical protein OUZ56_021501 [Daphnia magna]|uniref:Uncharacterized protein n=1 Tax=Daphnia magna TaxID=35525 RepID=A0ABQ9ZHI9_9CRUS|nr:hypothetical protein OUZ56_021501 [Daphnia magna]
MSPSNRHRNIIEVSFGLLFTENRLNCLSLLSIECDLLQTIDFEFLIAEFASKKLERPEHNMLFWAWMWTLSTSGPPFLSVKKIDICLTTQGSRDYYMIDSDYAFK